MAKPKPFDESMPLSERAAWAGLREVFERHAESHGFLAEDMLVSRMPGAGEARRSLIALLREDHGQAARAVAWMVGVTEGYVAYVCVWHRRRKGLPASAPKMTDHEMRKRWEEIMGRPLPEPKVRKTPLKPHGLKKNRRRPAVGGGGARARGRAGAASQGSPTFFRRPARKRSRTDGGVVNEPKKPSKKLANLRRRLAAAERRPPTPRWHAREKEKVDGKDVVEVVLKVGEERRPVRRLRRRVEALSAKEAA